MNSTYRNPFRRKNGPGVKTRFTGVQEELSSHKTLSRTSTMRRARTNWDQDTGAELDIGDMTSLLKRVYSARAAWTA